MPTVIVPEEKVTPISAPEAGTAAIIQPNEGTTLRSPTGDVVLEVPPLVVARTSQLEYKPVPVSKAPTPQAGTVVLKAFEINLYDDASQPLTNVALIRSITIRVKYTQADVDAVGGDFTRLRVMKYQASADQWLPLATTFNLIDKELVATVRHLSLFAVGASQAPMRLVTPTPMSIMGLPSTGDVSFLGPMALAFTLLGGLLVLGVGFLLLTPNPPMRSGLGVGTRGEGRGTRRSALDSDKWGRWRPLVGVGGADGGPGQRRWGGVGGTACKGRQSRTGPVRLCGVVE